MRLAKRWLHRDDDKIPQGVKPQVAQAVAQQPCLAKLVAMREELRLLWTRTNVSAEQLVADLQAWCKQGRGQRHRRAAGVLAQAARCARLGPRRAAQARGCRPSSPPNKKGRQVATPLFFRFQRYFSFVSL